MAIRRVWIEEGCIACGACSDECPEVFIVTDTTCLVRSDVRVDGVEGPNLAERAELKPDYQTRFAEEISCAAVVCPVDVIKYEEV